MCIRDSYNWSVVKHFNPNLKIIVFFRDPIARTKSHIHHIHRLHPENKGLTASEILQKSRRRLANLQARQLGYRARKKNFKRVLKNLKRLDAIGITEQFNKSIELINRQFEWNINYTPEQDKNQYPSQGQFQFTEEDEAIIRKINKVDTRLYRRALARFNSL